jgi:hypothetical protein
VVSNDSSNSNSSNSNNGRVTLETAFYGQRADGTNKFAVSQPPPFLPAAAKLNRRPKLRVGVSVSVYGMVVCVSVRVCEYVSMCLVGALRVCVIWMQAGGLG